MKLKRLKIERFRGVEPGTEILFGEGFNVLLGQNGTGKTTLLRLISSTFVGDFRWLAEESFAVEYELQLDSWAMRIALQNADMPSGEIGLPISRRATITIDVAENQEALITLTFDGDRISMTNHRTGETGSFDAKLDTLLVSYIFHLFLVFLRKLSHESLARGFNRTDQVFSDSFDEKMHARRFDESLDLFAAMTGRTSQLAVAEFGSSMGKLKAKSGFRTHPNQGLAVGLLVTPSLCRVAEQVPVDSPSIPPTLSVGADSEPFLADLAGLMGLSDAKMQLDFLGKQATEQGNIVEYGNLRFFFTRRDGSIINQDHLSYGQKRLLTFYYYLACNPHVVIADELVNGLHHSWIAECMKAMGDRQVFLTSQNPILLDHLSFDSADAVRKTFVTCLAKPEGPKDRLFWGNMSKKDAASFYKAYKVGIQHVGEILRTKGLW